MMERLERKRDFWALFLVVALVLSLLPNQVVVNAGEGKKSSVTRRAVRADEQKEETYSDKLIISQEKNGQISVATGSAVYTYNGSNQNMIVEGKDILKSLNYEIKFRDGEDDKKWSTPEWDSQEEYDSYEEEFTCSRANNKKTVHYVVFDRKKNDVASGSAIFFIKARKVSVKRVDTDDKKYQYIYNGRNQGPDLEIERDNGTDARGVLKKDEEHFIKSIFKREGNEGEFKEISKVGITEEEDLENPIDEGTYKISVTVNNECRDNYQLGEDSSQEFLIAPKPLKTIEWGNDEIIYGSKEGFSASVKSDDLETNNGKKDECTIELQVEQNDGMPTNVGNYTAEAVNVSNSNYILDLSDKDKKHAFSIVPDIKDSITLTWGKKQKIKDGIVKCDKAAMKEITYDKTKAKKYKDFFKIKKGALVPVKYCKKQYPENMQLQVKYAKEKPKKVKVNIRIPKLQKKKIKISGRKWIKDVKAWRYTFKYKKIKKASKIQVRIHGYDNRRVNKYLDKYLKSTKSNRSSFIQLRKATIKKILKATGKKKIEFMIYAYYGRNKSEKLSIYRK